MSDLPTDLDTLLEAVEVMMGAKFAADLEGVIYDKLADAWLSV